MTYGERAAVARLIPNDTTHRASPGEEEDEWRVPHSSKDFFFVCAQIFFFVMTGILEC